MICTDRKLTVWMVVLAGVACAEGERMVPAGGCESDRNCPRGEVCMDLVCTPSQAIDSPGNGRDAQLTPGTVDARRADALRMLDVAHQPDG